MTKIQVKGSQSIKIVITAFNDLDCIQFIHLICEKEKLWIDLKRLLL